MLLILKIPVRAVDTEDLVSVEDFGTAVTIYDLQQSFDATAVTIDQKGLWLLAKNRTPQLLRLRESVDTEKKAAVGGNFLPRKAAVDLPVKEMQQFRRKFRVLVFAFFSPDIP